MSKIVCRSPFYYCDIGIDGNVYICCNKWCSFYSIGNILYDDLNEIFFGQKIQEFIEQFETQKFKYCRTDICLGAQKVDDNCYQELFNEFSANSKRQMRLNFDTSCNVQCIFCRHNFSMADKKELEVVDKLISKIEEFLPQLNEHHWDISVNGVGEVFVSQPFIRLIKNVTQNYPNINFQIITNGVLCSESMLENLGITNRISGIEVSVHANTEKTYNSLIKGGNFEKVCQNLKFISKLKQENIIKKFHMNFTITSLNYHEMVDFARWSLAIGASPSFLPLLILNENERDNFDKLNVVDKNHPQYNKFLKVIDKLRPLKDRIYIPESYFELESNKTKSFIDKLLKR